LPDALRDMLSPISRTTAGRLNLDQSERLGPPEDEPSQRGRADGHPQERTTRSSHRIPLLPTRRNRDRQRTSGNLRSGTKIHLGRTRADSMTDFVVVFGILVLDALLVKGLTLVGFTQLPSAIIVVGGEIGFTLGQLAQAMRERPVNRNTPTPCAGAGSGNSNPP
jgi:hypothetical protein